MADALLVLNAGSSSLKFSLFAAGPLDLRLHGEIEHIGSAAHFVARDSRNTVLGEKRWSEPLGHTQALAYLLDFLPREADYASVFGEYFECWSDGGDEVVSANKLHLVERGEPINDSRFKFANDVVIKTFTNRGGTATDQNY